MLLDIQRWFFLPLEYNELVMHCKIYKTWRLISLRKLDIHIYIKTLTFRYCLSKHMCSNKKRQFWTERIFSLKG